MLGAIVFQDGAAWFFKATARRKEIDRIEPAFRQMLSSVTFGDTGEPKWELPENWTKSGVVVQLRHATIIAGSEDEKDPDVEVTISTLPWTGDKANDFVLRNVNRWRGQLGVRPALLVELLRDQVMLKSAAGDSAILVHLDGRQRNRSSMMPPGHPPAGPSAAGPDASESSPPSETANKSKLKFVTPEGWSEGAPGQMRKASLIAGSGDSKAEITVIDLGPNSGTFAENVNRWRGQVLLENVSERVIEASAENIDVGGSEGKYVELIGPKDAILGVIVPTAGKTWFIKLRGPSGLAEAETTRFKQFVQSLELQ